jgi:DNA processing protein
MERDKLKYWVALSKLRGVPREVLRKLLDSLTDKDADDISPLFEEQLTEFGLTRGVKNLNSTLKRSDWNKVEEDLDFIEAHSIELITIKDRRYPGRLLSTYDPPFMLYAKGTIHEGALPAVAIVGTRRATSYGLAMAEAIGRDLAEAGVVIVSGMARGCDSAAHKGALSAGGLTTAVLGTGIDKIYPSENKKLYDEIAESGLLLSEFPLSTPPLAQNFPIRNRIISGLSLGVLVIEAPFKSGAMMTARLALDDGRDVYALPGQTTSKASNGPNKLIKDGALLIESAEDIIEAIGQDSLFKDTPTVATKKKQSKDKLDVLCVEARGIADILAQETAPLHIDEIAIRKKLKVQKASALLLEMELKGLINQLPGKLFMLKP